MSSVLIKSKRQKVAVDAILSKSIPSYRQAYSDRTAWLMACMSELAYIRFNPLTNNEALSKLSQINTKSERLVRLQSLLEECLYDHNQEKAKLESELAQLNYHLIKTFDCTGTQAILAEGEDHLVLAFRGTESTSIKDIKTDAKAIAKRDESGGKIHSGFDEAYHQVSLELETTLESDAMKNKPLFITGHSLGGALATIAAKKLRYDGGIAACYTFGAPRVGDDVWISNIKTPLYRIVNAADCVTMLPPSSEAITVLGWLISLIPNVGKKLRAWLLEKFDGYIHGGNMRYLTNCATGDYQNVKLLYSVSWFFRMKALVVKKLPWKKTLADHSIRIYRAKLFRVATVRNGKLD